MAAAVDQRSAIGVRKPGIVMSVPSLLSFARRPAAVRVNAVPSRVSPSQLPLDRLCLKIALQPCSLPLV